MVQRVTLRTRKSYNTKSNRVKKVKTPGGKLVVQYRTKTATGPSCSSCGSYLQGIPRLRPYAYSRISKRQKTVTRAYGGNACNKCSRERIIRAFLVEEQKIVKHVLKRQEAASKKAKKTEGKTKEKKQ